MYTALGAGVGVDAMIALTLSLSLSQSRTGFKRYVAGVYPDDARSLYVCSTDSLVNILMAYTINTSLLTRSVAHSSCCWQLLTSSLQSMLDRLLHHCEIPFDRASLVADPSLKYTIWPHEMTYIGIYFTLSKRTFTPLHLNASHRSSL